MSNNIIYSDIDATFQPTAEGDIAVVYNLDSIRQSIKNIILTPRRSRTIYQDPDFGCGVFDLLFEKMNSATELLLREEIETAIENYEPRVEVIELTVNANTAEYVYSVLIKYRVLAINIEDDFEINLEVLK